MLFPDDRPAPPDPSPPKTLSLRGYARHRKALGLAGRSLHGVQKALAAGRISLEPGGGIDPAKADAQWLANTDALRAPEDPGSCAPKTPSRGVALADDDSLTDEDLEEFTFASERAKKERIERRLKELELRQRLGDVVEISRSAALNFRVARQIRVRFQYLPDRLYQKLAAESDPLTVHAILTEEIDAVLELLGADPSGAASNAFAADLFEDAAAPDPELEA
jgi:hypothetical protein